MKKHSKAAMGALWLSLLLLVSLGSIEADAGQDAAAPDGMQLFLLIGQSNMAGRGKVEPQDQETDPRIFMLTKELHWTLAKDPVHFDKPVAGVGLCSQFARTLLKNDANMSIGLIPAAMGGTSLDEWKAGGKLYKNAIDRAREAMKKGKIAGILWHQGEADSAHEKVATYGTRFAAMISQLRKDLGAEHVPVVIGELGHFRPASAEFNTALPEVARRVPLCASVTAENLVDRGDHLHFDSPSLRTFGERYAAAYLKLKADAVQQGH
jgi:hypothetical protein